MYRAAIGARRRVSSLARGRRAPDLSDSCFSEQICSRPTAAHLSSNCTRWLVCRGWFSFRISAGPLPCTILTRPKGDSYARPSTETILTHVHAHRCCFSCATYVAESPSRPPLCSHSSRHRTRAASGVWSVSSGVRAGAPCAETS